MLYIVRCILEMQTPLHCGEGIADGLLDAPVARDAFGYWRIPGSTIAGILRTWIREQKGEKIEQALFGQSNLSNESASLICCSDAVLLDYDHKPAWLVKYQGKEPQIPVYSFIRDHVRLDQQTGSVQHGGKFDEEYVPAGTRFAFEFSLDCWKQEPAAELVESFASLVYGVKTGKLRFGAHAGYNYGTYSVIHFQARKFDFNKEQDLQQWLQLSPNEVDLPNKVGQEWQYERQAKQNDTQQNIHGTLSIPLCTSSPILIAGGNPTASVDADMCFAQTAAYNYNKRQLSEFLVLPGSSIRGAIRHRVFHIMQDLGWQNPDAELNTLFGIAEGKDIQKGQLGFSDAVLQTEQSKCSIEDCTTVQHVAIDRFTGGAMDAHLFNEAPLWQKDVFFYLQLTLYGISPVHAALLLHALMDLAEGKLPLGNGVNRGNGRLNLDKTKPIHWNLVWNDLHLKDGETQNVQQWLSGLARALKEKNHVATL